MLTGEQPLIEAARRGELPAATELVDRHYAAVFAFLRRLTGSEDAGAELTQRTFSRVWPALAQFAGRSSLRAWLHGIAFNVYRDWRRQNHRFESRSDPWWLEIADANAGPDQLAVESDLGATLCAAVEGLEPDQRSAVHLHYYQGLTLDETAEVVGVATSTVKYRLRGALEELQKRLEEPAFKPAPFNSLRKR